MSGSGGSGTVADHWSAVATVALLGADRRRLPALPTGPVADLVDRRDPPDPASALADRAAALTIARRSGVRPGPVLPTLITPPPDPRPGCPPAAIAVLETVLDEWPELFEEWLALVRARGWRLPGDVTAVLLARFCAVPSLRAAVVALAGPLADWLSELFPAALGSSPRPSGRPTGPEPVPAGRPVGIDPATIAAGLESGEFGVRHKPLLQHVLRSLAIDDLEPLADALGRAGTNPHTMGLALSLADLARTRLTMIRELTR